MPLLKIPSLSAPQSNAGDWRARFCTVENTFAARIGQICNAAMDRSVIAYSESAAPEERKKYRREIETLAILSGLEIDASKSGIRPDLDAYIGGKRVKRSAFLQYKYLAEQFEETRRAWYDPSHKEKLDAFFEKTDWSKVDSHIERLPYLARQLEQNTPRIKAKPAKDSELFRFAQERGWKNQLDMRTGVYVPGAVFRTKKKPRLKRRGSSKQISEIFTESFLCWWMKKAAAGFTAMYMG